MAAAEPVGAVAFVDGEAWRTRRWLVRARLLTVSLGGWRRAGLALALGLLAAAALPPVHGWPLLIPAFTGLVWLVEGRRPRSAVVAGWWFGLGFFAAGLYWIGNAFAVAITPMAWAGPPAVLALAAGLALFTAAATGGTRLFGARGPGGVLVFAALWTTLEWLRGWILTGFPWNLIGSVWVFSDAMIQVTSAIGVFGLSLLTVTAAAMPATLAVGRADSHHAGTACAVALSLLLAVWIGGIARLMLVGPHGEVEGVRLRLVQPNIDQAAKWRPELADDHFSRQIALSEMSATQPPTHIIWAETATPFVIDEDQPRRERIASVTPAAGLTLLGTLRRTPPGQPFQIWNSLQAVDADGAVVASYDKAHLVPFGEYVPLREILGFAKLTAGSTDFSAGAGRATLPLAGIPPVSPLICYEVIFPGEVVDAVARPRWLLNVTNDGWYGHSAGPYQHFASARLRAVEEGLPLVRVANTGISAIVDAYGRIVAVLGLGEAGIVDGPLPTPTAAPTVFARFGNAVPLAMIAVTLILGCFLGRRQAWRRPKAPPNAMREQQLRERS